MAIFLPKPVAEAAQRVVAGRVPYAPETPAVPSRYTPTPDATPRYPTVGPEPERGGFVTPTIRTGRGVLNPEARAYDTPSVMRNGGATGNRRGLFGSLADLGRDVVPQGVRDVAGAVGQGARLYGGEALGAFTSGIKYPLNNFAYSPYTDAEGKSIGMGDVLEQNYGRTTPGRIAFTALDQATAPATFGAAAIGGPESVAAIKNLPLWARVPANIAMPASQSANFATRLAAETAIGTAGTVGAQEAAKRTDNPWLVAGAGLGAGVLASGAVSALPSVGRGVKAAGEAAASPGPLRPGEATPRAMFVPGVGDVPPTTPLDEARQSIMDALQEESRLRRSGVVEAEKAAGRARQAAQIEAKVGSGQTVEQALQAARQGARVGKLRQTFGAPIELSDAHSTALVEHLTQKLQGRSFEQLNGLKALDSVINGEGVQPAQLKLLRRVFGDDFAKAIEDANVGRPSFWAPQTPEMKAAIQSALPGEKQVAAYEQRAAAQMAHADNLMADFGMNPTNTRLKTLAEQAKVKGIEAQDKADALSIAQGRKYAEDAAKDAERRASGASRGAARDQAAEVAARLKADAANKSDEMLIAAARKAIGEEPGVSSALDRGALADFDYIVKANRAILDNIGETAHEKIATVASALSGNMADSYLTALLHRKMTLEGLLEQRGMDRRIIRKVGDLMVDAELKRRYPAGVPERLMSELEKTKGLGMGPGDTILKGAAAASGEMKKAAFWADFGIMGQAGLNAAMTPVNILTGLVNRAVSAAHLPSVDTAMGAVNRDLQYARDGLMIRGKVGSSLEGAGDGWILRGVPGLKTVDAKVAGAIDWTTRAQYDVIMGELAKLKHEGNLTALKILGRDISDPAVRATSASMANAETMKAFSALSTRRATAERALLLSPSMRRAQVTHVLQLARTISPSATPEQRILGALGIMSTAVGTLAVGKLLNDAIGVGDFVFDPSKPGYGQVVLKDTDAQGRHRVISMFPQQQVVSAHAKAMRALAEGDPALAAREWGKLGLGSSSQVLQTGEKAAGFGFEPGRGWRFGDYGKELPADQRIAAALPIPPVVSGKLTGQGTDFTGTALDFGGLTNYPESPGQAVKRPDFNYSTLKGAAQFDARQEETWRRLGVSKNYGPTVQPYANEWEWRQARTAEIRGIYLARHPDWTPEKAQFEAEREVLNQPVHKAYVATREMLEDQWVEQNPAAARDLWYANVKSGQGWIPTQKQRAIIEAAR